MAIRPSPASIPLTTSCDAHEIGQIGAGFDQVRAGLATRGGTELVIFVSSVSNISVL
jgi:hypothetical protein